MHVNHRLVFLGLNCLVVVRDVFFFGGGGRKVASAQKLFSNFVLKFGTHFFLLINVKVTPYHSYAGTEGRWRYGSHPFTTHNLALEGGWWSAPHSSCFTPPPRKGMTWYLLYRRLGGPQGQSGWYRKSQAVQFIMSHYTG